MVSAVAGGTEQTLARSRAKDEPRETAKAIRNGYKYSSPIRPREITTWNQDRCLVSRIVRSNRTVFTVVVETDGSILMYEGEYQSYDDIFIANLLNLKTF